jgi:hypothetical protein
MRKTDSIDSFDQRSTASTARLVTDFLPLYRAAMRRAVMKTQATQTDTTSAAKRAPTAGKSSRRSIPAYLTLSPRTSRPGSQSGDGFPEDFYGDSDDDDDEDQEEDAQQISLKVSALSKNIFLSERGFWSYKLIYWCISRIIKGREESRGRGLRTRSVNQSHDENSDQ